MMLDTGREAVYFPFSILHLSFFIALTNDK